MAETIAQLGVEVKPSGITETVSQLERLNQTAQNTVTMMQILNNNVHNIGIRMQGATAATGSFHSANKQADMSLGQLALRIAGYSTGLNLAVDMTRRAVGGMADMAKESVVLAASFERSRVAWGVFLRDVDAGNDMFDRLYELAQRTPLSFQGVEEAAQRLKGFGFATAEIIPTLERMGDVARGNDETMQRLSLAYGQALAQGRVLTRDLYQFVNAGVPIFEALGSVMGKTVQEVQTLVTDGKVGFPEIEKALKALTAEGGLFNGMLEKAAQTTEGKLNIAADNWKATLASIGNDVLPLINSLLDDINSKLNFSASLREMPAKVMRENAFYNLIMNGDSEGVKGYVAENYSDLGYDEMTRMLAYARKMNPLATGPQGAALRNAEIAITASVQNNTNAPVEDAGGERWRAELSDALGGFDTKSGNGKEIINRWLAAQRAEWVPEEVGRRAKNVLGDLEKRVTFTTGSQFAVTALKDYLWENPSRDAGYNLSPTAGFFANERVADTTYTPMTVEQAEAMLEANRKVRSDAEMAYSGFTPYIDRYSMMAGAGSPYMTQWQAEEALAMMDARIAESYRQTPAMNTYVDPYSGKVGGGVRTLSYQQQARSNLGINGIGSLPLLPQEIDAYLKIAEANRPTPAYNTYVDPYTKRVGAGVPYMTTAESQLALSMMTQPGREKDFFGQSWMMDRQYGISEASVWNDIIPTTDLEKFTAGQYELNQMMDEGKLSTEGYALALQNLKEQYDPATKKQKEFEKSLEAIGKYLESAAMQSALSGFYAIGEAMADSTDAAKNLEDGIQNIAHSILEQLPMMLLQAGLQGVMANPANPLAWGLIAASGMVAVGHGYADATAAQEVATTTVPNALGNVYPSRSLKQYENGVYNTPQFFAFAKGGVFGEAGYEAIMPLARSSTGQLGVKASVAPVNVVINNNAGVSVTSSETTNEAGERQVLLTIEKMMGGMVASGKLDKAMAGRYGTRVVGASRM